MFDKPDVIIHLKYFAFVLCETMIHDKCQICFSYSLTFCSNSICSNVKGILVLDVSAKFKEIVESYEKIKAAVLNTKKGLQHEGQKGN